MGDPKPKKRPRGRPRSRLNTRLYNALADAELLGPKQNSSKIDSRNKIKSLRRRSSPSPGPPGHAHVRRCIDLKPAAALQLRAVAQVPSLPRSARRPRHGARGTAATRCACPGLRLGVRQVLEDWKDALGILSVAMAIVAAIIYVIQTLRGDARCRAY